MSTYNRPAMPRPILRTHALRHALRGGPRNRRKAGDAGRGRIRDRGQARHGVPGPESDRSPGGEGRPAVERTPEFKASPPDAEAHSEARPHASCRSLTVT
ncbi:hypothetical protein GLE_4193 [Lysobacter enzymogenes]|uniref:Uncharacterized protein n=1 Tax=Lysobacter enzymogenes TaxID=69 RepID=A0A0S2DMP9_LYSEN|nr:hypothetical protein GLE_4193 [Lysobacter enzymogenes]